jgi:glyoxylase-like metal-dependent hydrolase (beta-lactamase superfamily II)
VFGDRDFTIRPDTVVVGTRRSDVEAFFGFEDWPRRTATVDLGDRPLTVIPIPGHEGSHIALYDHHSAVLFTGDTLYPGLLTIRDWDAYRASIARLVTFSEGHPISWILGGHVEMTHTPRTYYPLGTTYQPEEHPLHLSVAALYELQAACVRLGVRPAIEIHDDFVVYPLEGVATGVSDLDPDCCHPVTV